jgi:hypothetical protein
MLSVGAGTGLIYLLRWFWWRINAWSEIAAMSGSFLMALTFFLLGKAGYPVPTHIALLLSVAVTTVVWMVTTFMTRPVDKSTLVEFYKLVRPAGRGWNRIRLEAGLESSPDSLPNALAGWVAGIAFVYSALFGAGAFIYHNAKLGLFWVVVFIVSGVSLVRLLPRLWIKAKAKYSS